MFDNPLIIILRTILVNALNAQGYSNIAVKQANQPTQQGAEIIPAIYFFILHDHLYGWNERTDEIDAGNDMAHTETQWYETTFQFEALVTQDPANTMGYTAKDVINLAAAILRSDETREILKSTGLGILPITDIRNPYAELDRDEFQAVPSFDVTITHKQITNGRIPVVSSVESGLYPI